MRRHRTDWSSLVVGLTFAAVGLFAVVASRHRVADAAGWLWSLTLLGLGVALVLRGTRAGRGCSGCEEGAGDEVGAERREDREVQQAGGGHDG